MNFDRLHFVAERAEIGEKRESILAVTIPETPGSFASSAPCWAAEISRNSTTAMRIQDSADICRHPGARPCGNRQTYYHPEKEQAARAGFDRQ